MTESEQTASDYAQYLAQVPEGLREQIEPAFKSYHDEIAEKNKDYEPFREVLDQGWTPDHVTVGLNLLQELNTNPQRIFQALVDQDPSLLQQFAPQQIQPTGPPAYTAPNNTPPKGFEDLPPELLEWKAQQEEMTRLLFQGFTEQQQLTQQQQQAQQEQAELSQFKTHLDKVAPEDKYPRQFILSFVAQGQAPEEAVKSYESWRQQELSQQRALGAPLIAPAGGGGLPSEPIDTSKLSESARKNLMVQYLEAANRQR